MADLPLDDVQGLILRGYGMDALSVFLLRVERAAEARRLLGTLPVRSAVVWDTKPEWCLNVALTYGGLEALGLPQASLDSFPEDFVQGAVARAAIVGDEGVNAPEHWKYELATAPPHVLVLLHGQDARIREAQAVALRAQWSERGAFSEIAELKADMLPGGVAHFGYRDGFSQPTIEGGLPNPVPDILAKSPAGAFLLGYQSQFSQFTYPVPSPPALGMNGSFLALRLLQQDCAAFAKLLDEAPSKYGISGELLAAKMVGRWRNGVPLTLSPDTDTPGNPLTLDQLNAYDYAPTSDHPETYNDSRGYRCPVGSHMRRHTPRNAMVAGNSGLRHRIVRRGLPYGPPFDPAHPDDGIERGLLGLFIAVSLKDQFEFLMEEWVNGDLFAPGISGTRDPLLGYLPEGTGRFTIPVQGGKPVCVTFPQFVTTRGAAYAFLPSLSALRYIASL